MADIIPDLWGDGIDVADLSPAVILNTQAANLQKRTGGVITAQLRKRGLSAYDELLFDINFAATQQGSRILVCRYAKDEVYPAWISSLGLKPLVKSIPATVAEKIFQPTQQLRLPEWLRLDPSEMECTEVAYNQSVFIEILRRVLSSGYVKAKIASAIARSNEKGHTLTFLKEDPYFVADAQL